MQSEIRIGNIFTEEANGKMLFVIECQVLNGLVKVGSNMSLPFSAGLDMTIPIDEIEITEGQVTKIKVRCEDVEEIEFLHGLNLEGEVLVVN